ncbi:hypothetical protein [Pseudocolwellia agarivorans]|uniref:hypothetical protein n=1 Tax=Pseudocolwellia agarivorans TaxID=1911682 RepID=UPI000984AE67|nr:hypothetical protein [Pseudocolwellia agarivorans]
MRIFLFLLLITISFYSNANAIWPFVIMNATSFAWWAILIGLMIEFLFVQRLFKIPPKKAIKATIFANLASAVLGIVFVGLFKVVPGLYFFLIFGLGRLGIIAWILVFIFTCLFNVLIEGMVYKRGFKLYTKLSKKLFWSFLLANAITISVAIFSLVIQAMAK